MGENLTEFIPKYYIKLYCYNCSNIQDYGIPKGEYIPTTFKTVECMRCGCKSMSLQKINLDID